MQKWYVDFIILLLIIVYIYIYIYIYIYSIHLLRIRIFQNRLFHNCNVFSLNDTNFQFLFYLVMIQPVARRYA